MDIIEIIDNAVTEACIRTDRQVGLEFTIDTDESSSMYGETMFNILLDGEVVDSYYYFDIVIDEINNLEDTYG